MFVFILCFDSLLAKITSFCLLIVEKKEYVDSISSQSVCGAAEEETANEYQTNWRHD